MRGLKKTPNRVAKNQSKGKVTPIRDNLIQKKINFKLDTLSGSQVGSGRNKLGCGRHKLLQKGWKDNATVSSCMADEKVLTLKVLPNQ